VVGDWQG